MRHYLTEEDVRNFILDRTIMDNELQLDLTFSAEEIGDAMMRAAREFNSMAPYVMEVHPSALPGDSNLFLYGTAAQLYLSRISKLSRNDVDYAAGNITTNIVGKQIQHLKDLYKLNQEEFKLQGTQMKVAMNVRATFGAVG